MIKKLTNPWLQLLMWLVLGFTVTSCVSQNTPDKIQSAIDTLEEQHMVAMINQAPNAIPTCKQKEHQTHWYVHCFDSTNNSNNSYWIVQDNQNTTTVYALNGKALGMMDRFDNKAMFKSGAGHIDVKHTQAAIELFSEPQMRDY